MSAMVTRCLAADANSEPDIQVHQLNPDTYILRQSLCSSGEAPFMYLLFGEDKALLEDTGDGGTTATTTGDEDLDEALTAAHAIGDDALGHEDEAKFSHGSSEQRVRWFRRGFQSGDPTQCDTYAVADRSKL